ncbi:MAG TPA: hypothetical protein VF457_04365 [Burkholderiaceae bacterium]
MEPAEGLRARQPLSGLAPCERHRLHRQSGMHSPNADLRTDNDAFEIRTDVPAEDACLTGLRLLRMAVAQLELLGTCPDLPAAHRDAVDGIACLGRLACGVIGVVDLALRAPTT